LRLAGRDALTRLIADVISGQADFHYHCGLRREPLGSLPRS
jgi:hypothetical protein